jgi:hypothetical protein
MSGESDCPDIRLAFGMDDVDVKEPIEVTCNPDGTASVTIRLVITNTTTRFAVFRSDCGPGGVKEQGGITTGITPGAPSYYYSFTCRYNTPSAPTPFIEILDQDFEPFGCPSFQIPVDPIPACPPSECPQVLGLEVEILGCTRDPEDGNKLKRRVVFTPSLYLQTAISNHTWFFGDGESDPSSGPPMQAVHLYEAAPSVPPQLCIFPTGEDCEPECFEVPLSEFTDFRLCECPQIVDIAVQLGDCERDQSDGKLKRNVTFVPTLTGPTPSAYNWTFGDSSSDVGAGSPGSVSHLYEQAPATPPRLCIQAGAPCEENCRDVPLSEFDPFEPCQDDSDGGNGGPSWCGVLTYAIAALAALALATTLVLLTVQFCLSIPVPGWLWGVVVGLWAAVGVLIILAGILCRIGICPCLTKCDWLLISWVPSLAGAIVALYLAGCCGWMGLVASGLFLAALATFALWKRSCDPTRCEILDWLVVAIVSGVGPAIAYLNLISALQACGNTWVATAAATLGAALAVAATACHATSNQQARLP